MGGDEHLNGQKLHYEERLSKLRGQNQQIINETVQLRAKFRKSLQLLQVYQEKLVHGAAPQPGGDAAKRLQLFDSPQGGEPARPVAVTSQAQPLNPSSVESGARSRADAPLTTETARSRDASSDPDAVPFRTPPRDEPLAPALVSLDAKALQRLALDAKRELDARTAAYEAVVFASAPSARAVGARERETGGAGGDGAALGQLAAGLAQLGVHRADMPMLMAPTQLDGQRLAPEEALSASEVLSTPPPPSRSDRRALAGADALELAKPAAPAAGGDELDTLLELPALSLRTTTLALSPAQVPAVFLSPLPRALPAAPSPRAAQPAPPPSAERPRTDIAPARSSLLVRMPSTSACAAPTSTPGRVAVSQTAAPRRAPAATEPRARRPFAAAAAAAPLPPARAAEPAAPPPSHWQQSRAVAPPPHWQQLRAAVPAARTEPCALASARGGPHARAQLSAGFESVSDDGSDTESLFDLIEVLNGRGAQSAAADGGGADGIDGEPLRSLCALIDDMEGGGRNGRRRGRDADRARPNAVAFNEPHSSGRTRPLPNTRHALPSRSAPRAPAASARNVYTARVDSLLDLSSVSADEDDDGDSFGSAAEPFAYAASRPWR